MKHPFVPKGGKLFQWHVKDQLLVWVPDRQQPYTLWKKGAQGWFVEKFFA